MVCSFEQCDRQSKCAGLISQHIETHGMKQGGNRVQGAAPRMSAGTMVGTPASTETPPGEKSGLPSRLSLKRANAAARRD